MVSCASSKPFRRDRCPHSWIRKLCQLSVGLGAIIVELEVAGVLSSPLFSFFELRFTLLGQSILERMQTGH
ncbi:hypothetical protein OBBRIDRAFT_139402 [Obba rivulosa]|uniref:Uncharacterized protein n=1 Tax=Obba rivulosa TaxID=1052685 RepID=A0A8E2AQT0_9APHY|nr:hypothetical protein OBBRIDRAFT_139402 [Obba rivulosa]